MITIQRPNESRQEYIERAYRDGNMPDWVYYQLNGKTAQENYNDICRRRAEETLKRQEEKDALDALEKEAEEQLEKVLEKSLDDLLKDFGK